jgi:outer membrane protein TolC
LAQGQVDAAESWRAGDIIMHVTHENDQWTGDQDLRTWEAGVETGLALPQQRQAQQALAQSTKAQAQALRPYLQWQAEKRVRQLVWSLKKAKTQLKFQKKTVKQAQSLLDTLSQRYQSGDAPKIDFLLARTAWLEQKKRLAQTQAQHDKALTTYQYWTGLTQLPPSLTEPLADTPWQVDTQHPAMQYLKHQSDTALAEKGVVEANQQGNPSVMIGSKHERNRDQNGNTLLLAQISIPFGVQANRTQQLAQVNQTLTERNIALNRMQQTLTEQLAQAQTDLQTARALQAQAKEKSELSKQAMTLAMSAYQAGQTSIQDLLRLRETYFQDQLQARLAEINVGQAIAHLNQILGVPLS